MADDRLSDAQAEGLLEVDGLVAGGTAAWHGRGRFAVALEAGRTCRKGCSLA